ncbi:MAG: hypothetical protein ABI310_02975 [Microbacteriaceae bacterium]
MSPLRVAPVFSLGNLQRRLAVRNITRAARMLDEADDWATTLEEFVEPQPVARFVKDEVVYPWIAAVSGVPIAKAKEFSARAALKYPVHVQPEGALRPFGLQELSGGVRRILDASQARQLVNVQRPARPRELRGHDLVSGQR